MKITEGEDRVSSGAIARAAAQGGTNDKTCGGSNSKVERSAARFFGKDLP